MNVLHLTSGNLYGGVETVLVTMARERHACPEMKPQFAVCFEGRAADELRTTRVPVHLLPPVRGRFPWTVWAARRKLRDLISNVHFDIAVAHMSWPHGIFGPVMRSAGIPLVHYAHGPYADPPGVIDRQAARCGASLIIANSTYTMGVVQKLMPRVPATVILNPVQVTTRVDASRQELRSRYGVSEKCRLILQVGRLERWKGHRTHLEALALLRDIPDWLLWIAGGAQTSEQQNYETELRELVDQAGLTSRVEFLGDRCDVPELMLAADIFCQPNTGAEPFGMVFIEAMAAGIPVIGSQLGGPTDIISSDVGRLVPPGDPRALSDVLRALLSNEELRRSLGSNGPQRASALCSPDQRLGDIHRMFTALLNERR